MTAAVTGSAGTSWRGLKILFLSPTPTHPQDYGNRKRAYAICSSLKSRGASITMLHYPAESDWRGRMPEAANNAMRRSWDAYHIIPVTKQLHPPAVGTDHTIDEWWDPSIGDFLKFLFSVEHFDVFIVNYTWLSKGFTFAPAATVKILDTNDQFSGRREMLERHGIQPEFFHMTQAAEAAAIHRADLVWAIKEQEKAHFERLGAGAVVALPHLDDANFIAAPPADPDGYLRVGIIGARNNVNLINVTDFLETALPIFERHFAPIKLIIAGSISDELGPLDERFVEVMGRVPTVDQFYKAVDLVCIPIAFSTGLKIKAGEALSFGLPILSLAHAFEGYHACHRGQQLPDMKALAERIVQIAFERPELEILRDASQASYRTVRRVIDAAFDRTAEFIRGRGLPVLISVDAMILRPGSATRAALDSVIEYLEDFSRVTVLIGSGDPDQAARECRDEIPSYRVVIAAELERPARDDELTGGIGWTVLPVSEAVELFGSRAVILDMLPAGWETLPAASAELFIRPELMMLAGNLPDASAIARFADRFTGRHVFADLGCEMAAGMAETLGASLVSVPSHCRSQHAWRLKLRAARAVEGWVAILAPDDASAADFAASVVSECGLQPVIIAHQTPPEESETPHVRPAECLEQLEAMQSTLPMAVIDLSFGATGLGFVLELFERYAVPVVRTAAEIHQPCVNGTRKSIARDYAALFWAIRGLLTSPDRVTADGRLELESDAGWAWVRQRLETVPLSAPAELTTAGR